MLLFSNYFTASNPLCRSDLPALYGLNSIKKKNDIISFLQSLPNISWSVVKIDSKTINVKIDNRQLIVAEAFPQPPLIGTLF